MWISRSEAPTRPSPTLCNQAVLFVLQGAKSVIIGDEVLRYTPRSYFVYAVEAPATSRLTDASPAHPYLAIALRLDVQAIASLIVDDESTIGDRVINASAGASTDSAFTASSIDEDLLDALRRLLRLLDRPAEISALAPLFEREVLFRLLRGPHGAKLRELVHRQGHLHRIHRVIRWMRAHYAEAIEVRHLAGLAHMSPAAFHRHFKAATAMSPIQYQKQIRLLAARQLLITESGSATRVAFAVGYESVSQFGREYARRFGCSPARDAARFRARGDID